ncbi:MAG TPA: efflux RND transporter periplasmic adaptor subunit [Thermoanaerobaculia bacterium]|nr:efflux RND transporter periplasmic adaptor subunit [Thermoanaerobaculia bacterium]
MKITGRNLVLVAILACVVAASAIFVWNTRASRPASGKLTRIATVTRNDIQVQVREIGTVRPTVHLEVKSALSGHVVALRVREGDRVRRGDVMAIVEPDLGQAQAFVDLMNGLRLSKQSLDEAQRHLEENSRLHEAGILPATIYLDSKTRVDAARESYAAARRKYELVVNSGINVNTEDGTIQTSAVRAPIEGVVLTRSIAEGESVVSGVGPLNAGTVLFTIAGAGPMTVKTAVSELHIGKVALDQDAEITIDSYPGLVIPARVRWIAPAIRVEDKSRVFDVDLEPLGQHPELRSGMTVNVQIAGIRRTAVPTLPVEAVFERGGRQFVYRYEKPVVSASDSEEKRALALRNVWKETFVRTGITDGTRIEILEGLTLGDRVALEPPARSGSPAR